MRSIRSDAIKPAIGLCLLFKLVSSVNFEDPLALAPSLFNAHWPHLPTGRTDAPFHVTSLSVCAGVFYMDQGTGTLHYVSIGVTMYYETRGTAYNHAFPPVSSKAQGPFPTVFVEWR